jgi:WXXGXW repeat (2 copies)
VYEQPVCPGDGYLWTPGYWAWDADGGDYYWVPGTWVEAPEVGYLWTPGYWGWADGFYIFHAGYWGPHIGFYGGINYGFGYFGHGFDGGHWDHDHFFYNRSVVNVNVNIRNVYEQRVDVRNETRVSYNGGNGGINERPRAEEVAAERDRHVGPVGPQVQHEQAARSNQDLRYSANHGKPPVTATSRPGEFNNRGGSGGGGGGGGKGATAVHPKELPPAEHYTAPKTGNPKTDQKYQQQADKLAAQQEKQRQNLQQKQEQEHQKLAKQSAPPARTAQVEQKHQQQTQQLQQKHQQQQQQLQTKQAPPNKGGSKK